MKKQIAILIALTIFLCGDSFSFLSAQEKQDTREEAMQTSLRGRATSTQGSQQETAAEFEKATTLESPEILFQEKIQKEQAKVFAPESSQEATTGFKSATTLESPEILFQEKIQKEQGRVLAPPAVLPQEALPLKKKLAEKKKEEKEKEKTAEVTKVAAPESVPEAEATEEREYYIDIGDVLDISVWELPLPREKLTKEKATEEREYYIDIGDVLDISVWQVPDLSRSEVIVRPDGKISFPLIGDIKTEGLSLTQLDDIITEKLKAYIKTPEVSIMIRRFGRLAGEGGKIDIDKATLRSDLSRSEVIVRPDGKISYPLIGDIKAEGLTIPKLDDIITDKLKAHIKIPDVTIMIRRFGEQANKVVILGEILSPGIYNFRGPPTITEAIASAGGYTKYAVLNSIMVIRGDVRTKPEAIRVNFAQILKTGKLNENILLKPNDIIYVPRSFIAKVNTFLEVFQPAISQYMQTLNARYLHNLVRKQ